MSSNNMASSFITLSTKESSVTNVTLTTKTVQSLIDEEVELTKRWTPTLKIETSINKMLCQNTDVISLIKTSSNTSDIIRFSTIDYPIEGKFKGNGWKKLKSKICTSAIDAGYSLYSNGSISTKDYHYDNRQLKYTHGRIFSTQRKKMIDHCIENNAYRKNYITNDKKLGNRKDGKHLPRRRTSVRPSDHSCLCPFKLVIGVDESSFFISRD